ncbi:MAG: TrkH family potassium uptake protein [Bacteroidales bacterium]|nr:TrkH family potassium uptake protein [Bacteroidales bacterium]
MSTINFKSVHKIIGLILIISASSFLLCIPVALTYSEPVTPFLLAFITALVPGAILYFPAQSALYQKVTHREGYLSVTLGWTALVLSGTLPYIYSGAMNGFVNILFESVSGYTTTGASTLTDIEIMPRSVLFWRSLTHWIGGIGIILLVIIILPSLKVGGYSLFSMESSLKEKILPRTKSIAKAILLIYLSLTVAEIILLTVGGMELFDSICHSFGTIATGGFSTKNTSIAGYSDYIQYVISLFMFLAATSYVVFYFIIRRAYIKVRANEEFWFYIFFTTAAVVSVTMILFIGSERTFEESFRHSLFQVISTISTTGYATSDYTLWPAASYVLIFLLIFAGGSTGSTTGGIKMARHLISLKNLRNVTVRLQHPNAIIPVKLNGQLIPDNINSLMTVFIQLYVIIFIAGMMILLITGIPPDEAAGASAASLSCVGPGLGASGNLGNFAHFNGTAKITMVLLMIIGRLEIFTIVALFTRTFWRN